MYCSLAVLDGVVVTANDPVVSVFQLLSSDLLVLGQGLGFSLGLLNLDLGLNLDLIGLVVTLEGGVSDNDLFAVIAGQEVVDLAFGFNNLISSEVHASLGEVAGVDDNGLGFGDDLLHNKFPFFMRELYQLMSFFTLHPYHILFGYKSKAVKS